MHELRDAFRALRATPLVSAVAVLSLGLGIGANTAIFSIANSLLLRALPVREPERLVRLTSGDERLWSWTNPIWEQIRDRSDLFDGALAWGTARFDLAQGGQTDLVNGIWASGSYFGVLGVPAILGRTFTEADDARGGGPDGPVAVISYGFWQRRFGGRADVIGRSLSLNRTAYTIVGVTPPEFFGTDVGRSFDVAVPIGSETVMRGPEHRLDQRSFWWLSVMARLKSGQSLEAATAAVRAVQLQVREATLPGDWSAEGLAGYLSDPFTFRPAGTGNSGLRARYQRPLVTLMVVVGLALLIACANIANLLLARATARRHELSVRQALGASKLRLARQLLAESLLLSGCGATLGLLFAAGGSRLLVRQLSTSANPVFLDLSLDWRVLGFTAAAAVGTALLFGTAPAFGATRVPPIDALKEQGRGVAGGRMRVSGSLVVAQVALSLVLVVSAALFVRTFASLATLDLGFHPDPVLVVNLGAQQSAVEPAERLRLYERVRQAILPLAGVASAGASVVTPVSGSTWQYSVEVVGEPAVSDDRRGVYVNLVSPAWFATYGTALLAGRDFEDRDVARAPRVAIVNETFVRRYLQGANPIGRMVRESGGLLRDRPPAEIVGLVADAVYRNLRDPVPPTLYLALAQMTDPSPGVSLSIRSAAGGSPALLTRSVTDAIGQVDRDLTLTFRPLADQVNAALTQERVLAMLSGFFGGLALLLAGLGLYGVTAYAVHRRRGELGIRMALGAPPGGVVRLVLHRVALLVGAGVLVAYCRNPGEEERAAIGDVAP
ncbi:MAG: ABC transporter permease [Gemmatimonadetes bacterium]|nr:ABC transporter permease [Gemmatimonadota bacterium]